MFSHQDLKARQRAIRGSFAPSLSLRTHRALSWLGRAENEAADDDARFLFMWIAFNAAYANEIPDRRAITERKLLIRFLGRLVALDQEGLLHQIVHGGSAWNSGVNRGQMKDGANILGYLVPVVIHLMMENHNQLWGDACYPVLE